MEILERYAHELQTDLHAWAKEHVDENPHLFTLLDIDQDRYPDQRMSVHTIKGVKGDDRLPPEVMNSIATKVDKRYEEISRLVDSKEKILELAGETLESCQNVILGTDHGELIDIALESIKLKSALMQRGYDFETGMIVNKMVTFLGVKYDDEIVPATNLLKLGIEELYLNIPNTNSSRIKMNTPKKVQREFNERMMLHGVTNRLKSSSKIGKAMLLGIALSGTVNKPLVLEKYMENPNYPEIGENMPENTRVIGRASIGLLKILSLGFTLPASAMLEGEEMKVNISDRPLFVNKDTKLNLVMNRIAMLQQENDPLHHYIYDINGDLPVKKPATE